MIRFLVLVILCYPAVALAHTPYLVSFDRYEDNYHITDTKLSQALYGTLDGFSHTYEFSIASTSDFFAELLVPDIAGIATDRSAVLVKKKETGGVTEIGQLNRTAANWESYYEWWGGDRYRQGPTFTGELEPGDYILEVNTPENFGKYVLVVGTEERFGELGYFSTVGRIYEVKKFFGKPGIAIFQSPIVTVPTILLLSGIALMYWFYRRRYA